MRIYIYITGYFENTVDFDPNSGVSNATSNGSSDIFIQKLDSNGIFYWVKTIGGSDADEGKNITVTTSNEIYVTGWFNNSAVDFDPTAGTDLFSSTGLTDCFFQKYNQCQNTSSQYTHTECDSYTWIDGNTN